MTTATIHQAKTHLSQYIKDLEKGSQSIVIKRYNTPVARIIPYNLEDMQNKIVEQSKKKKKRNAGMLENNGFWIADDFNESLEDDFNSSIFPQ